MPSDIPNSRARLARVMRDAGDVVWTDRASELLDITHSDASKLLARWAEQGWLKRIGPGIYLPVPLNALESEHVLADPWLLVPPLFDPAYITGWSAAEYWDLTEQIFREIVVKTARPLRSRRKEVHGISFILRRTKRDHFFGTKTVWRGRTKIAVADIHRCMVDMLDEPYLGGGIQHVNDCLRNYFRYEKHDYQLLIAYAEKLDNGAVYKRLGFLAEREGIKDLVTVCNSKLTSGHAKLDPTIECPRLVTRWRLRVPESWVDR